MKYSITQNGLPLDKSLYTLDEKTKTFSSKENNLVLDFGSESNCTFKTGSDCTFKTGSYCTFNTSYSCTFNTGAYCTFNTSYSGTFITGSDCTFRTGSDCTFKTGAYCTFDTRSGCTFDTDFACTFNTSYSCTFNTKSKCVVVRRDIHEVIELKEGIKTTLNGYEIKGYTEKENLKGKTVTIEVDGKKYEAIFK